MIVSIDRITANNPDKSTLAFRTLLDQNSTNPSIDTSSRDPNSHCIYPSERKTQTHPRHSSYESHPPSHTSSHTSSHSSSQQWSKTTNPPRVSASEDTHLIKPHHSPTAENYVSSEAFLRQRQHQAGHPEEHRQDRLPGGLRILVTRDYDVGYFLDLSGLAHPNLIRPRVFARLGINEEHHQDWQLFRHSGSRPRKYPLNDLQVWDLCLKAHQYLLLLVLVVVPGGHSPSFINRGLRDDRVAPSNFPYQTRHSQPPASLVSSDSWPAPRSPASDTNARPAMDTSHSQTNHKLATKTSSAIAFIHSKIENVLSKPKTGNAAPSKSPVPNGLVHPRGSFMSSPVQDHIKALPLPINLPSDSAPISSSPGKFNAQGTPWMYNMAHDKVIYSLKPGDTPGVHDLEPLPHAARGFPDSTTVHDNTQLVTASGTSPNHSDTPLHYHNEVDTSLTGIFRERKSSKDYINKKTNFYIPDSHQIIPPLDLDGEDSKTMTEMWWEELAKHRTRSVEEESQSDSLSCGSLGRFPGDHTPEADDEDFEPTGMFQVEMKAPQKQVVEGEIKNAVAEQDEVDRTSIKADRTSIKADRTSITSGVNSTGRSWAVRPPVDQVYETLEKSFPYHDLDEQIELGPIPELTKESGLLVSPDVANFHEQKADNHPAPIAASKFFEEGKSPSINRARSIRTVAEERINQTGDPKMRKPHNIFTGQREPDDKKLGGLSRIKSTKLWGVKTEEVPPLGQARKHVGDIPRNSTVHGSPRAHSSSFKWARGRLIGKGSFGEVYLALNITKGDMLAVKRVTLTMGDSQLITESDEKHGKAVAALRSEVVMLKDLEHPNIVQYLGFEETTEFASIFLEYVPGGSVGGCIRAHGAFELQVTKSFTIQTVEGLKYLHHSGILHRDLKSDNILVDLKGNCKIADFGISKVSSKVDAYQTNTCMSFKGTAFYMAPEIITNQKGYSAKADIWSLGCVVLEMMCGRRPWSELTQLQALFKVGIEGVGPPIPGDLELDKLSQHFFQACFSRNPKDRPVADKLSNHLFLTVDPSWCFEGSELFRAIGTQKINELFNE